MRVRRLSLCLLSALAAVVGLAGCNPTLTLFSVPADVAVGSIFEVAVLGVAPPSSGGKAGCVMQLPVGFSAVGAVTWGVDAVAADPVLATAYVAEPGHFLVAYRGDSPLFSAYSYSGGMRLQVRAPATVSGPFTIKVALAGLAPGAAAWVPSDPVNVTNFASIAGANARTIQVVEHPSSGTVIPATRSGSPWNTSWSFGDVDGDGHLDIFEVANGGSSLKAFLWRSGSWLERAYPSAPLVIPPLVAADFDHDGCRDLIDRNGQVLHGDCGNSFVLGTSLPGVVPDNNWNEVLIGDVDNDGWPDAILRRYDPQATQARVSLSVFRNNGGVSWSQPNTVRLDPDLSSWPFVADMNGDGNLDLLYPPGVWFGDGHGQWSAGPPLPATGGSSFAVGDVDGDGAAELVTANLFHSSVWDLQGSTWVQSLIQGAGMQGSFLVTIDWDGDGVDEIVMGPNTVTNLAAPMRWARNLGGLQFAVAPTGDFGIALIPDTQTGAAVTDLDGNGVAEFVLVERGDTWSLVFLEPDRSGATRIGSACGAPAPVLTAVGTPSRGNINFACDLTGGQPNGAALLWIGASQRTLFGQAILPIELSPFGAPGCWLRTEPTSLAAAACDAVGSARWVLPIPNDPALLRATAFLQCAVPQAGANPAQLVLSAALAVRIR